MRILSRTCWWWCPALYSLLRASLRATARKEEFADTETRGGWRWIVSERQTISRRHSLKLEHSTTDGGGLLKIISEPSGERYSQPKYSVEELLEEGIAPLYHGRKSPAIYFSLVKFFNTFCWSMNCELFLWPNLSFSAVLIKANYPLCLRPLSKYSV